MKKMRKEEQLEGERGREGERGGGLQEEGEGGGGG